MRHIHSSLGGGTRVTVRQPRWPVVCACCCKPAETVLPVQFDDTDDRGMVNYLATWQVPYCTRCVAHVKKAEAVNAQTLLGPGLSLGSLGVLAASWFACVHFESKWPLAVTVAAVLGLLGLLKRRALAEGRRLMRPECSNVVPAVWCTSHKRDEDGDHHTFAFNNPKYAKAFESLNSKAQ